MIVALLFAKGSLLKFQLYSLEAAASASVVKRHTAIVVGRIALLLWHSHKADQNIRVIDYFLLANIILETVSVFVCLARVFDPKGTDTKFSSHFALLFRCFGEIQQNCGAVIHSLVLR